MPHTSLAPTARYVGWFVGCACEPPNKLRTLVPYTRGGMLPTVDSAILLQAEEGIVGALRESFDAFVGKAAPR